MRRTSWSSRRPATPIPRFGATSPHAFARRPNCSATAQPRSAPRSARRPPTRSRPPRTSTMAQEKQRRRRKTDVLTLVLLGAMYALLAANLICYVRFRLPIALHVAISTLAIHLSFTIWHEAVHGTV